MIPNWTNPNLKTKKTIRKIKSKKNLIRRMTKKTTSKRIRKTRRMIKRIRRIKSRTKRIKKGNKNNKSKGKRIRKIKRARRIRRVKREKVINQIKKTKKTWRKASQRAKLIKISSLRQSAILKTKQIKPNSQLGSWLSCTKRPHTTFSSTMDIILKNREKSSNNWKGCKRKSRKEGKNLKTWRNRLKRGESRNKSKKSVEWGWSSRN